jgi:hypothetical protein
MASRDPRRLSVGIYPTLTRRTIGEAVNVVEWSAQHGADVVAFHRYVPVAGAAEESPADSDYDELKGRLKAWCSRNHDPVEVLFESECLNAAPPTTRRTDFASSKKAASAVEFHSPTFPTEPSGAGADPFLLCTAPRDYVEIGLEGQVSACCRSQDVPLGYATSVESFADVWLGANYDRIRASLERGASGPYPLPNCQSCVDFFARAASRGRRAVDYSSEAERIHGLSFPSSRLRIEEIHKDTGHCVVARLPPGIDASGLELWEDEHPLGPAGVLHDDIRALGAGRYDLQAGQLHFSTSDFSDAQRNGRVYTLRPPGDGDHSNGSRPLE